MYYLKNSDDTYLLGFYHLGEEGLTTQRCTRRSDALELDHDEAKAVLALLTEFDYYDTWRVVKSKDY